MNTVNKRWLIRTSHLCHRRRAAGRNQQVEEYKHTHTHTQHCSIMINTCLATSNVPYNTLFMMPNLIIIYDAKLYLLSFHIIFKCSYSLWILLSVLSFYFNIFDLPILILQVSLKSSSNGRQTSLGFCLCNLRSFNLSVREIVIFLTPLSRECTGAMVVNFVRMSFSCLAFVLFYMNNRNLDESNRILMFDKDITLHLQSKWIFLKHLLGAIRIDK